jgi:hypothetical protein
MEGDSTHGKEGSDDGLPEESYESLDEFSQDLMNEIREFELSISTSNTPIAIKNQSNIIDSSKNTPMNDLLNYGDVINDPHSDKVI